MRGRTDLIDALTKYFEGHIAKHKVNIDNLLDNQVALAEHPDIVDEVVKLTQKITEAEENMRTLEHMISPLPIGLEQ